MGRPNILVVNDDGIHARGLAALVKVASTYGTPYIMAPDKPQSGQGHAITIHDPIRARKVNVFEEYEAYECSGTPVDCVKLASHVYYKDVKFDLCVSGINHGSNAAINIIYSGTMSAAMEGSILGIPSVGFSYMDVDANADFTGSSHYAGKVIELMLNHSFEKCNLLNVNIPKIALADIKGMKICKQGKSGWTQDFVEARDPQGHPYYWMTGEFLLRDKDEDTDIQALANGFVSIVPSQHDLTSYVGLKEMSYFEQ